MSLDIYFEERTNNVVFDANITHNLGKMAEKAGVYKSLWRLDGVTQAKDLIKPLTKGLKKLKARPRFFKKFDASNGWGTYEHFVPYVEEVLQAAIDHPEAYVTNSR